MRWVEGLEQAHFSHSLCPLCLLSPAILGMYTLMSNKQYYDATKIDSTPRVRVFTKITVPLLSPMLAYVVITGFIGGFKEYSSIVGIFGDDMQAVGGESLNTMVGYIYDALGNQEGRASAAALILFAIIFVVTMINLYVSKKKTHY